MGCMKLYFDITHKQFSIFFVSLIVLSLTASFVIFQWERINSIFNKYNRVIFLYQMDKLEKTVQSNDTIIVGDSSGGNSIDSVYFSNLSNQSTQNLALTGDFGLVGTFEMMTRALEKNPELKNIIIIQTLHIWKRPFSKEGIFEFGDLKLLDVWASYFSSNPYLEYLEYSTQVKNILELGRYVLEKTFFSQFLFDPAHRASIDIERDYLKQGQKTYANSRLHVKEGEHLESNIDSNNEKIFRRMDAWCGEKQINCLYLNGPIHETIFKNSVVQIQVLNQFLGNFENIKIFPQVFFYENGKMGDSGDHVDVSFKRQSTQNYFELVKDYLKK